MSRVPNPIRGTLLWIGLALARVGLVDRDRTHRAVDLAWPRIVTGLARMSKNAVDVAMVGVAIGSPAIAGVGFAGPFFAIAWTIGAGISAGTIALASQRYGAEAYDELGQAARSSVLLVLVCTLPFAALFWLLPETLIDLLANDPETLAHGTAYLKVVALGVPFAGLNLVGSRLLIGADDAWTPMVIRATGAAANVVMNAVFIFGLGLGAAGAALGTVVSNALIVVVFAIGVTVGRVPVAGTLPVQVSLRGRYVHRETIRDLVEIGAPVVGRNSVRTAARFPMLAIVAMFGSTVVAAYVISRRIFGLLGTPGWGFGLAASSLVGQSLGESDEGTASAYGYEITRIAAVTYALGAVGVLLLARPIVVAFVGDPADPAVPTATALTYAACVAVVGQGVARTMAGALDATGDTRWPFYSRALAMFGVAIPSAYVGATTAVGLWGLYFAYFGQTYLQAAVNYYRFSTGKWKAISRQYRPDASPTDD